MFTKRHQTVYFCVFVCSMPLKSTSRYARIPTSCTNTLQRWFFPLPPGDHLMPIKNQTWAKRFVEVSEGSFRYFNNRTEKEDTGVVVPLVDSFVSVHLKRYVRLESKSGVRIFRAPSEARARHWVFVISRYCFTAPVAEGTKRLCCILLPKVKK